MKYFVYKSLDVAEAPCPMNLIPHFPTHTPASIPHSDPLPPRPSLGSGRQWLTGLWPAGSGEERESPAGELSSQRKEKPRISATKSDKASKQHFWINAFLGFAITQNTFFFFFQEVCLWKKLFSREHNVKKLCQKIFPFRRGWQENCSRDAPKNI